ncbi:MAG: galactose-1-phosphate uridylyltransferase [Elusimicrobia bacterium CG1_02_37_114]|nr:MAG: galactose-1-phosphate uridylyltransferase [Elusimicrobia bacterium CG1_02_37_114]PIV54135.1 MAG: galactose-1-phosphate uridylyltransferase [Elusimicrobia bacterium CG02_land_8_20_14_3_00_37_13]PIZ13047.1 MAG: galactose-1-phosphate uridylyltransferase [Elusimicrobia bacterium CG_4_10_14_0_8_um_filter_37_32]
MPELRRDPVIGRWVIISSERGRIPSDFGKESEDEEGKICSFCPGNEHLTPSEVLAYRKFGTQKDKPGWWVRVVPNKYPVLKVEDSPERSGEGMYDKMNGVGAHEVIIETPEHKKELSELDDKNVEDIIWAYRDRIMDLKRDIRFEYILIFKNKGTAAGASLVHPHSQLIALPMVPIRVQQEIQGAKQYYDYKQRCVFCDIIREELENEQRIVIENDDFVALCPFASRFPFEIWILPKKHDSQFEDLQKHEAVMLTQILKSIISKINNTLGEPPYNYLMHTSPLKETHLSHYHWHLEVMPKLTKVAGFEWGTGFYINPTSPEEAAKYLREIG